MSRNGSGTYNRAVSPYVAGTTITAATVNSEMDDIATALTGSMSRDGQSPPTANIPMGGFRLTGLANAIASTDAAALGQVVAKAGDTMTGALEVNNSITSRGIVPEVKYIETDTGTTIRTLVDGSAWDIRRDDYSILMSVRNSNGQIQAGQNGTAAAPAYSFTGDQDTGIFNLGPNQIGMSVGGAQVASFEASQWIQVGNPTALSSQIYMVNTGASASQLRILDFTGLNENYAPLTTLRNVLETNGSSYTQFFATPAGSRASDRRALRMTIPGAGQIEMVGPVNVTSGALQVAGNPVQIQRGTEQATTSGTAIDFTGIPAGVRRITVMFDGVSFTGADSASIQLGDSGGIETTGYSGNAGIVAGASSGGIGTLSSAAVVIYGGTAAADNCSGVIQIVNQSGNKWLITGQTARNGTPQIFNIIASKTLSDVLDRIRFKVDGASSFDAGAINIMWEF